MAMTTARIGGSGAPTPADDVLRALLTTEEGRRDPYPLYRALHREAPLHRWADDGMWYAVRYDTCRELLLDPRLGHDEEKLFRRPGMTEAQRERMRRRLAQRRRRGLSMVTENPPDHTRLRRLVSRAFTTPRVEQLRGRVEALVDEHLDRLGDGDEVDVMTALAFPLPVTVIGELVGVPAGERQRFRPLITEGMQADGPDATEEDIARAERNFEEIEEFFTDLIAARRARPEDDLLSALIAVRDEGRAPGMPGGSGVAPGIPDGRLSEDELMSTVFLLFFAGFVTTTNVIGNGLLALLRHPAEMDRLWSDGSLVAPAVEEILRYDSPVPFVVRDVLEPTEVEGVAVRPGDHVVALLSAANRDPARFRDPGRFDVARAEAQPLTFGWGIHHCLGAPLARLEAQVTFARLRERFAAIELLDDDPPRAHSFLRGVRSLPVRVRRR